MVKITVVADCGNSPKKTFLKDLNIAFAEGNVEFIANNLADDVTWETVGHHRLEGKDAFVSALNEMRDTQVSELTIERVITHGKEGAVNGVMATTAGKRYAFCDVYEFKNAAGTAIRSLLSYVIETSNAS